MVSNRAEGRCDTGVVGPRAGMAAEEVERFRTLGNCCNMSCCGCCSAPKKGLSCLTTNSPDGGLFPISQHSTTHKHEGAEHTDRSTRRSIVFPSFRLRGNINIELYSPIH